MNLGFWFRIYFENESVDALCDDAARLMAA
jgi:hypothetical protein